MTDNFYQVAYQQIFDEVKANFMGNFGAQAWYALMDRNENGLDSLKEAIQMIGEKAVGGVK